MDADQVNYCAVCKTPIRTMIFMGIDYLTENRFPVLRCDHCGIVQTGIDRHVIDYASLYRDYYGNRHGIFEPITNWLRWRKVKRYFPDWRVKKVLDIGCGKGGFLRHLKLQGWQVNGVELIASPYAEFWKRANLEVTTVSEVDEAKYSPGSFDLVTFWHVFEHLPSPPGVLDMVFKVLKPMGILVIAVPNINGLQAKLFKENWFHLEVPRHLFHFSKKSLSRILQDHGFDLIKIKNYSLEYDTFGALQSCLNLVCYNKNFLFDLITGRKTFTNMIKHTDLHEIFDLALTSLLSVPLFVLAIPFCWISSSLGSGATLEVYAVKKGITIRA